VTCFWSVAGMLPGEVCCGAAVAAWLEIGRPLTPTSVSVASAAECCDAALQTAMSTETATTGWNWKGRETAMAATGLCRREEGTTSTAASCD